MASPMISLEEVDTYFSTTTSFQSRKCPSWLTPLGPTSCLPPLKIT